MNVKQSLYEITRISSILVSLFILLTTTAAVAASVTLRWEPNGSAPEGYRIFARKSGQVYNYSQSAWEGTTVTGTINNLEDQTEYYFVVRAHDGSLESTDSNEVHYIPPTSHTPGTIPPSWDGATTGAGSANLDSRFAETTLTGGVEYYTDRDYQLTGVPSSYDDMVAIITPNADRNRTDASGYLTFTMPYDGAVYVAYDSRATSEPNWMNGFLDTGDILETSLSTQPSLKIYSQDYDKGDIINFGANKTPGFTGGTVSNYIVFYSNGNGGPTDCALDSKFKKATMAVEAYYYTDRNYTITDGFPDWILGRTLIQTPNNEKKNSAASGYVRFTNPVSWWVYVLFDSRSSSIPTWLNGWELLSQYEIKTSLETQPYMKVYRKWFNAGQCVDLGGNYGPGSSSEYRSNYMVVYGK